MTFTARSMLALTCLFMLAQPAAAQILPPPAPGLNAPALGPPPPLQGRPAPATDNQRTTERDRAGQAFTLVDYFDYPATIQLAGEEDVLMGVGNDALWECLETRAAKIALATGQRQQASR